MRYINLALIHVNGCTTSTQVWTNDPSEAMKQFEQLIFDARRKRNDAILGAIVDGDTITRYLVTGMRAMIIKEARS